MQVSNEKIMMQKKQCQVKQVRMFLALSPWLLAETSHLTQNLMQIGIIQNYVTDISVALTLT